MTLTGMLATALFIKLLVACIALGVLLARRSRERRQTRELSLALEGAMRSIEAQLGATILERDQYARHVIVLREQLVRIGTVVTRRPIRRRWLALSRRIAREAAQAELVVL